VLASQSEVALDRSETFLRNQDPEATCGTQEWEHSIDVSLSADLDGSGPGNNHPDHDNLQM